MAVLRPNVTSFLHFPSVIKTAFLHCPLFHASGYLSPCLTPIPALTFPPLSHSTIQHPLPVSSFPPLSKDCLVAASKTSSTPSPVKELHSKYFLAPILLRTSSPSSDVKNFSDRLRISSCATGSSRRSFLRPTRIIGTLGQRSRTSGCLKEEEKFSPPLSLEEGLRAPEEVRYRRLLDERAVHD